MSLLSEEKINEIFDLDPNMGSGDWKGYTRTALVMATRAIIAAVLSEQQKQEPTAWIARGIHAGKVIAAKLHDSKQDADNTASVFIEHYGTAETVPLFASPTEQLDNFQRANNIVESWPEWKQNYKVAPVAEKVRYGVMKFLDGYDALPAGTKLYTAPIVQPDDLKDAERYRMLRNGEYWPAAFYDHDEPEPLRGEELDAAIDAAMAAEKEG